MPCFLVERSFDGEVELHVAVPSSGAPVDGVTWLFCYRRKARDTPPDEENPATD